MMSWLRRGQRSRRRRTHDIVEAEQAIEHAQQQHTQAREERERGAAQLAAEQRWFAIGFSDGRTDRIAAMIESHLRRGGQP